MQSTDFVVIEGEQQNENVTPLRLECINRNLATNVCLNSNCSSFVFLCIDKTCECYKKHRGCIKGSIQSINEAIQEKLKFIEPFQKRIDELIENAINELSNYRQKIIQKAKQDLNFIGLTSNQRKFLKALKTKKVGSLTGKQMNQIFSSIDDITGFDDKMKKNETLIQQVWNSFNISMKKTFNKVESYLEVFSGNIGFELNQSLVIKTEDHRKNLLGFFDKKIEMMSLLYRASQNSFDTSKFYQNCNNIKNTLVICETEYGKVIGGFCANNWKTQHDDYRWVDESGESFVFSLTNCDKFILQQSCSAFRYRSGYGPMFGNYNGTDFFISNKANQARESGANINNGYYNSKYTRDSKDSWEMFSGGKQDFRFLQKNGKFGTLSSINARRNDFTKFNSILFTIQAMCENSFIRLQNFCLIFVSIKSIQSK